MPPPIVVAHRGLHHIAIENTLDAFRAAADAQVAWVECDVWLSADGVPVVIHDQTLERTTSGHGNVGDHTLRQLQQLKVPSLWEVLGVITDETGILIEIKPPAAAGLVAGVRQEIQHFSGPWMIQSFYFENVDLSEQSAALAADATMLQIAMDGPWKSIHADHVLLNTEVVDRLHRQGRKVGAWTVNAPAEIQRMIELGIDMLITDEPLLAAQIIATRSP
jgi:glycerophosphoryl diester phosphodiesterase